MGKNICIVTNNSGGLYGFRRELIQSLIDSGNKVVALTPFDDSIDELKKLHAELVETRIDRRGINPVSDFRLFLNYFRLLKETRPDYVITYTIKPNAYAGLCCILLGIPYAANITGLGTAFEKPGMLQTIATILYKAALSKAKCVFFENSSNKEVFISKRIIKEKQAVLLNGAGVNLEHFELKPYPQCESPIRFLFMGRIMKEKGVDELFTAMKRLVENGNSCILDVCGNFEEDYESRIKAYSDCGWLCFHGYQQDVRPFIEKAHCFVLPSWHEGMANTNLESAAMGRPVITSDIPGCREAVVDGISGFLCEAKNADDLYCKMSQFVMLKHAEKEKMGLAGRVHVQNVFDKKAVVEATISSIINSR